MKEVLEVCFGLVRPATSLLSSEAGLNEMCVLVTVDTDGGMGLQAHVVGSLHRRTNEYIYKSYRIGRKREKRRLTSGADDGAAMDAQAIETTNRASLGKETIEVLDVGVKESE